MTPRLPGELVPNPANNFAKQFARVDEVSLSLPNLEASPANAWSFALQDVREHKHSREVTLLSRADNRWRDVYK